MLNYLTKPTACLLVQATLPVCRYLIVKRSETLPELLAAGAFEPDPDQPFVSQLQTEIDQHGIPVRRVVLLLPRNEIEVDTLRLPPANDDELPELVANLTIQKSEDDGQGLLNDFLVRRQESDESCDVLTFSASRSSIQDWQQQFKSANWKLIAITFGGLGAVRLLQQVTTKPALTSLVVTTTDQDTDLAVIERGRPVLFRTIPRAAGGERFVVDQLAHEIHRTLTLEGHPEDESTRVYLIGTMEEQEVAAKMLSEKLSLSVSVVNPFDQLNGQVAVPEPSRFANLVGIACSWNRHALPVDLLNPRRPPAKASPWRRVTFWSVIAASILALASFLLWEQSMEAKASLELQRAKLQRLIKPVTKSETTRKTVEAIEAWRSGDIGWLDELRALSDKLPPPDRLVVRSLTLTMMDARRGQMDLSLEVSDPQVRLDLEQAIRDDRHMIASKRRYRCISTVLRCMDISDHDCCASRGSARPTYRTRRDHG